MKALILAFLMRQPLVREWLLTAAKAKPSEEEVKWTKEDGQALEGFLHTATGQKLALVLENLKADADACAVLNSTPATAYGFVCVARGVRQAIARIKKLSAAGQSTGTEPTRESLPPELEHLSDT